MSGGEALFVELLIPRHMESGEVDACADNFSITVGFSEPPCGTGQIAAAGVGTYDNVRITVKL